MNESPTDRRSSTLRLSVVIASSNDEDVLSQCIDALASQALPGELEVLVVRASDRPTHTDRRRWMAQLPSLQWVDAPAASTVPQLRSLGIAAARAETIALLEDDCVVSSDWCRHAMSLPGEAVAVGGAVEPGAYQRALDWAVYFSEYARFMLPVPSTPNAPMPGNNVVYSHRALLALPTVSQSEFNEAFVHDSWQRAGVPTMVNGALVVRNVNSWSSRHVTSVPFHHGRAFAGRRFRDRSPLMRIGFALLVPGLPLLKVSRIVSETLGRGRLGGPLMRALPLIFVFALSWSAGEFVGCLAGEGDSPSRWR